MSNYPVKNVKLLDALESLHNRLHNLDTEPDIADIEIMLNVSGERPLNDQQIPEVREKLIQDGYIEIDGDLGDKNSLVQEVRVKQFKNDIDYQEPFELPEDINNPRNSQLAHYFAPWIINNHDVRSVLLDLERNSYEFWSYDQETKIWRQDGIQKLKKQANKELEEKYSQAVLNEIKGRLEAQDVIDYKETGAGDGKVAVKNGILDLKENKVRDIQKEDYVTSKLPVRFKGGVGTPDLWEEYLQEVVPSQSARDTLQEFAGYCLMPWTAKYERGLMLLGPTDSGKSVFLDVMRELLGKENVSQESLQDLSNSRWGVASLKGKLANIDHDLDPKSIEDVGTVKKLTSGNEMMAERKREKKFEIKPTAKLMFSANRVPDRNKEDDAFYNRWLTVTFPETIPDEKQDPDLIDKLTEEERIRGILRWAIEGQRRLMNQQEFTGDLDPLSTKELWKEWGNSVERFVSRHCVKEKEVSKEKREDMDFKVHFSTLFNLYEEFARINGFEKESKKGFTQKLRKDPEIRKGQPSVNGKQAKGFFGVKIKQEAHKNLKNSGKGEEEWPE